MGSYPTLDAYLATLPQGIASYPDACGKGALVRQFTEGKPFGGDFTGLPVQLQALLKTPPAASAWVPEVHLTGLLIARREHEGMTEEQYVKWVYELNVKLLQQPLFKLLMLVVSPEQLLKTGANRWGSFHQGTTLTTLPRGRNEMTLMMTFRDHLFPAPILRGYSTAFVAAVEAAGGKNVRAPLTESSSSHGIFQASWNR